MFRTVSFLLVAFLLSACGGGNVATRNIDNSYDQTGDNSWSEIKKYTAGSANEVDVYVVALKGSIDTENPSSAGKPKYYFGITADTNLIENSANGAIVWTTVDGGDLDLETGNGYYVSRSGVNQAGQVFTATTQGLNLNLSGSEFVSYGIIDHDDLGTLISSGSTVSNLPNGKITFNINASGHIVVDDNLEDINQLSLIADFEDLTGSMTAVSDNFYMSATDFNIDPNTGSFSGDIAEIGELETTFSLPAEIIGAFAGRNAGGAHGFLYNSGDNPADGIGVFIVQR